MISRDELLSVVNATGLTAPVVEKDYVLGWLLRGIETHPALRERWVFKGGTCLKKCYFETYRFSEDLDFTLRDAAQVEADFLARTFSEVARAVHDEAGVEIPVDRIRFDIHPNPRGGTSCQGRVYYRSRFQTGNNLPAVKLDITADELLVEAPVWRPVGHDYPDAPHDGIEAYCYSYEELFAEKLRALGERTRARDLYDVIHLFRNRDKLPDAARVREILVRKCAFKQIPEITLEIVHAARDTIIGTWEGMLRHQLPELPPFEAFWNALPEVFTWLTTGAVRPAPAPAPMAPDTVALRPRFGGLRGFASTAPSLEKIRFAAQNRLLVELHYVKEDGQRRTPTIEPYSLRQSQAGDVSLAAFDVATGQIKTYRIDRIRGARVLERTFTPRYAIELSPSAGR